MFLKETYYKIKRFILWLLVHFLPRPISAPEGSEVVSEKGILEITIRLFCFLSVGICIAIVFDTMRHAGYLGGIGNMDLFSGSLILMSGNNPIISLSLPEYFLLSISLIYYVLMPFLRYVYKWLKVTGPIYAIAIGFILTCSIIVQNENQNTRDVLSIVLAVIFSLLPAYLIKYKNFKLSKRFSTFTYVTFAIVTVGGSLINILDQIPFLEILSGKLIELSGYYEFQFSGGLLKVFLAFFFLFIAYDRMRDYIRRRVSRQYEWLVAFTGFYTFCIIVLKVSDLLELATIV